ncbi:LuxR C-terminal-related transcriptional regulator [Belliella aquatica]|uniref:Uncharacterized protein n=1 Tax=Belliella aquatica TaxID=1323734 RepID=A0ABQ1MEN6_9BACT|nr:DNA-binding response regulator [Belliella aquatica]MCH7405140.1 DNA-binding response regulator [Belliella aquatica]GGC39443.1 hypothetical protein GCM10010993_17750 [Belliella aquatica]
MHNILILGLEKIELNQFEQFLPNSGYFFVYSADYTEAIERIDSGDVDLVICNAEVDGDNAFKVYNVLESFLRKNNIPVFLVVDQEKFDLVKVALEIGVDNIIFKPFNFTSIERKIQNQFKKSKNLGVHNNESFLGFFQENSYPMLIIQTGKVKFLNRAFEQMIGDKHDEFLNTKVKQLFDLEIDPLKYHQYKRLESGLIPHCTLNNVNIKGIDNSNFELFLVRDSAGYIIAQINISQNDQKLKNLGNSLKMNFQSIENEIDFILTHREKEVYKLSANGLPIKIIAERLKLSPRTVEKHRSNIMEKVGAKNMIEAINLI